MFYLRLQGIEEIQSSWALTLLSLAECITYVLASFFGDYLKGRLVYVNVIAAGFLSIICFIWPIVDITFGCILVVAIGKEDTGWSPQGTLLILLSLPKGLLMSPILKFKIGDSRCLVFFL